MQYVKNGPDIPDSLNEALEKGRVIFFCGAGISYPAGLPDFARMTKRVYYKLGGTINELQKSALNRRQYDTALDLLERHRPNGEVDVRRTVAEILTPKLKRKGAMDTHEALLTLGQTRTGKIHVVTTNFDPIFEALIVKRGLKVERFKAPLLPVPKHSLNGLTYLHGLIEYPLDDALLRRIIITSGDFGRAYLTDRWAARFVSELFRNFTVCFVGYSIDDLVMRYMMDALAADRRSGEPFHEMYAFAGYGQGKHDSTKIEWQTKNVTPIMYSMEDNHALLHKSIQEWAWKYRDGLQGRVALITEHAGTTPIPNADFHFDYAVRRVLWALGDELAAKHFAEMDPCPPLGWLGPLDEFLYSHDDLGRFGVPPHEHKNDELTFSYLRRYTPYHLAPFMTLVNYGGSGGGVDGIMRWFAEWLSRHLNDPNLIVWFVKRGGHLHPVLAETIRRRIDQINKLMGQQNDEVLKKLAGSAPNAIPNVYMRKVLQLFVEGRVKTPTQNGDIYAWRRKFAKGDITPDLRMELRELLTPYVVFRERAFLPEEVDSSNPKRVKDIVDWEIALAADGVHHAIGDNFKPEEWRQLLPEFLPSASALLRDAMDLMRMLDGAGDRSDLSYYHQPSISEHEQNRDFHDWTFLVEVCRDGWREVAAKDATQALAYAVLWFNTPYPLFKRLAFFCAAQEKSPVPTDMALSWLLGDGAWWLWSVESQREVMRFIVAASPRLSEEERSQLEAVILRGPPREMYKTRLTQEEWERTVKHQTWHLLAKVDSVTPLGEAARAKLDVVRHEYPDLAIDENQMDEFPFSMSVGWGRGVHGRSKISVPTVEAELVQWLRDHPTAGIFEEDDWDERCRKDRSLVAAALQKLASEGIWPEDRWRTAIQVWSEDPMLLWSWSVLPNILTHMPEADFNGVAHTVSHWVKAQAKIFTDGEGKFFALCERLLAVPDPEKPSLMEPVTTALNSPGGEATQALFTWWYRQNLKDGIGLDQRVKPIFTALADRTVPLYRHARIFLTLQVVALFRVDERWTREHILTLFDWNKSNDDAVRAWAGFLWSPQLFLPFIAAIKPDLLETAKHYKDLQDRDGDQYAHLLAYISLDPADLFQRVELAQAIAAIPQGGLEQVLIAVVNGLKGAQDRREEYWTNRVEPFLKEVWPQDKALVSEVIAAHMGQLCINAGRKFPEAMNKLVGWLMPIARFYDLFISLQKSGLCVQFPEVALEFMHKLTSPVTKYLPREFGMCLVEIGTVNSSLKKDYRYRELEMIYQKKMG